MARGKSGKNHKGTSNWSPERTNAIEQRDPGRENDDTVIPPQEIEAGQKKFSMLIDGVPYIIRSIPFLFNGEYRFRVIIQGGGEHIFTWDSELKRLRAINDDASVLPDGLEEAISERLQSQVS